VDGFGVDLLHIHIYIHIHPNPYSLTLPFECRRKLVDGFGVDLLLTPSQSVVLRNVQPAQKFEVEALLKEHGIKMIDEVR